MQCIQLATQHDRPTVASAKVYVISGASDEELSRIKKNLINPVESMESPLEPVQTLHTPFDVPADVAVLENFNNLDQKGLEDFIAHYGLAMDLGATSPSASSTLKRPKNAPRPSPRSA